MNYIWIHRTHTQCIQMAMEMEILLLAGTMEWIEQTHLMFNPKRSIIIYEFVILRRSMQTVGFEDMRDGKCEREKNHSRCQTRHWYLHTHHLLLRLQSPSFKKLMCTFFNLAVIFSGWQHQMMCHCVPVTFDVYIRPKIAQDYWFSTFKSLCNWNSARWHTANL